MILDEQALLYEYADCVGARAFLKMAGLPFRQEQRPNAEFMSPLPGKVPFLKLPNALVAEFDGIVDAVTKRVGSEIFRSLYSEWMIYVQNFLFLGCKAFEYPNGR